MKFLFIILCLATSNLVIAGSFDYQGIHGKISNLSNFENQNLVVRASICGVSRRSPCEKKFEIESQVSAEGDYQLRNQKLSCRSCRRFRVIHYIQDTKEDGSLDDMNLHLWDLRLSNFCNFKCRSCGLDLSSSWHSDQNALAVNPRMEEIGSNYYNNDIVEKSLISVKDKTDFLHMMEDHYKCVDEIYFAGGEPLLMPEHYQILDKLIELGRTNVKIRYSTNFSKFKFGKKHVFDYWKQFKNLQLWVSVDGIGKIGEYVRHGFKDKNFDNQIKLFTESGIKPLDMCYMVTYGAMNYLHLFDMIILFIKRNYVDYEEYFRGSRRMYFSPISYPNYLDSRYLPNWVKLKFFDRLKRFPDELKNVGAKEWFISDIMQRLNTIYSRSLEYEFSYKQMNELIVTTEELDKLRKENFNEVFPYYNNLNSLSINDPDRRPPQLKKTLI